MAEWPCCHDPLRFSPMSLRFVPPPPPSPKLVSFAPTRPEVRPRGLGTLPASAPREAQPRLHPCVAGKGSSPPRPAKPSTHARVRWQRKHARGLGEGSKACVPRGYRGLECGGCQCLGLASMQVCAVNALAIMQARVLACPSDQGLGLGPRRARGIFRPAAAQGESVVVFAENNTRPRRKVLVLPRGRLAGGEFSLQRS